MDSLIGAFESTVSANAHILQQFISADFFKLTFVPIAIESIRAGSVRAEVIDRVVDPTNPDLEGLFERVFIAQKAASGDVAQAAIFVLGNADDKVVSTGEQAIVLNLYHKIIIGSDGLLLGNQEFEKM